MRVAALVESDEHVCCRYRVAAFRPLLCDAGIELTTHALPHGGFARLRLFHSLRTADVVVLQRALLPRVQLAVLRRSARRLVFDFDDAVWMRDSYSPRGPHSSRRVWRFARTMRAADTVFAGNAFLAETAAGAGGGDRVRVVPTCVDPAAYPVARQDSGSIRLVWVGSASTLRGLDRIRPIFDAVADAVPGARLKVICDAFPDAGRLPVDSVRWDADTEAAELADAEIGIAWVPDDAWSRGKCGLKVLQYQAAGLPVVANPVGVHATLVRPGETGFLATTPGEWAAAVQTLAADPGLRTKFGAAGRKLVEREYSVGVGGRAWVGEFARVRRAG